MTSKAICIWFIVASVTRAAIGANVIACSRDDWDRAMTGASYVDEWGLTLDSCQQFCYNNNFRYAGTEWGQECFCDNWHWKYGEADNCDTPCTGDEGSTCGGDLALTVMDTGYSPCNNNPCANGGNCVASGQSYTCQCSPPWTGNNCETYVNPCDKSPCANGGACTPSGATFSCTCVAPYTGSTCQTYVNPCDKSPCANGGACTPSGATFSCTCVAPYTGSTCQTYVDPCAKGPCANGGACTPSGASYTCKCPAAYTGNSCETLVDPCAASPCANGGTCTASGASFTCACVAGWKGNDCKTDNNYCLQQNPCKNGATCEKYGDSYTCTCSPGFAGVNCELDAAACKAVADDKRINCGWGGVTLEQCNARSCCYDATAQARQAATCFYSQSLCSQIPANERVDCYKIPQVNEKICKGWGCCWDASAPATGLKCFRHAAKVSCLNVPASGRRARKNTAGVPNDCEANGGCWDSGLRNNQTLWCFDVIG